MSCEHCAENDRRLETMTKLRDAAVRTGFEHLKEADEEINGLKAEIEALKANLLKQIDYKVEAFTKIHNTELQVDELKAIIRRISHYSANGHEFCAWCGGCPDLKPPHTPTCKVDAILKEKQP